MNDKKKKKATLPKKEKGPLWNYFRVKWTFLHKLCGQTPADPKIIAAWIRARRARVRAPGAKSIDEINAEVLDAIARGEGELLSEEERASEMASSKLVFCYDLEGNLAMRAATVKAHIKDCSRVLHRQYIGRIEKELTFATRVANGVYPLETQYWIPILDAKTGQPRRKPDGEYEKPIHVRGPRGETLNALKCFDYVTGVRMEFILKVLGTSVAVPDLHTIFQYGGTHGYAGERGDGEGKYIYELNQITEEEGQGGQRAAA